MNFFVIFLLKHVLFFFLNMFMIFFFFLDVESWPDYNIKERRYLKIVKLLEVTYFYFFYGKIYIAF